MRQSAALRLALPLLVLGLSSSVQTAPVLTTLTPASAPPGAVITVGGTALEGAVVIWAAGTPDEQPLPTSLGGTLFTIPRNATAKPYQVAIQDASGRSQSIAFTVAGTARALDPRIDHVNPLDVTDGGNTQSVSSLYVQGANIDVGAVVELDGVEVATVTHQALYGNAYGVDESELGYPVRHYVALAAVTPALPAGTTVSVRVRNLDGRRSEPTPYSVPAATTALDSDGDALPDQWEAAGHDSNGDGQTDVDPYRRDLLVEIDVMDNVVYPLSPNAIGAVRTMFAMAPVMNPYTASGIHLVVELGEVPSSPKVVFDLPDVIVASGVTRFSDIRNAHFGRKAMGDRYHYVLWAREIELAGKGISDQVAGGTGDDVLIGLDASGPSFQTVRSQAELLAHELGHNLGLRHGGLDDDEHNPSHWSVMSYTWVLRTGYGKLHRIKRATCLPFYYAAAGQTEPGHTVPSQVGLVIGYSAGSAGRVTEGLLDEQKGVCAHPLDWDQDGAFDTTIDTDPVDANDDGDETDTLDDFAAWRALRFNGPATNGEL